MLDSDLYSKEVRDDEALSQQFGIRGVPYFVINRKYGISGAQPVAQFVQVLEKAQQDDSPLIVDNVEKGDSCDVDGCD